MFKALFIVSQSTYRILNKETYDEIHSYKQTRNVHFCFMKIDMREKLKQRIII